ncbi:hypothetical protein [Dickeya fangzhongdai]|uniref:hypothetical protein n=1 Tax=Dickeya fangzhongdai TaxID=1778540 RepID=UPI000AD53808|nr:hypothetical protein [Dickeya fangzhongdai]
MNSKSSVMMILPSEELFGLKVPPGFISSEALLYFVRNTNNPSFRETLLKSLLERVHRNLPKPNRLDGKTASMSSMAIRDKVRDDFIDLMLLDQADYDERLDYFEVNFNGALASDRVDTKRQVLTCSYFWNEKIFYGIMYMYSKRLCD